MTICKFCQKNHSDFHICFEHRLWRKVREELNRNPNKDIIFTAALIIHFNPAGWLTTGHRAFGQVITDVNE